MKQLGRFGRHTAALAAASALLIGAGGLAAWADNLFADGDGLAPVANNPTVSLGDIACGEPASANIALAIERRAAANSAVVYANSAVVTISVLGTSGAGLTAQAPASTLTLPSNWTSSSFGTMSSAVAGSVTVDSEVSGPGSGSVTFRATGAKNGGGTLTLDTEVDVTWTTGACATPDTTPPVISYELSPTSPDGNDGWYTSNVTLTWTVTEDESPGSLTKTGCVDQNITADQHATEYSCSAASDGGAAGPVTVTIKRDATPPVVSLAGGPAEGDEYVFGSVPAAPGCTASDATSGLAQDCSVSGYGTTVGEHTVTASAEDQAGNTNTDSATYEVLAWDLTGFYRPVDMDKLNTVKGGSTVPLKFNVYAGSNELTSTSAVSSFTTRLVPCSNFEDEVADPIEVVTTGGTSLRYDSTEGQFIQNWKTPKGSACYVVTMTTQDGSKLKANFQTK